MLRQTIAWRADPNPERPTGDLFDLFLTTPGAHKWHHYFPIYEKVFGAKRRTPLRLLEIGIDRGGSLKLWKRYFHPDSRIVGLDIKEECRAFHDPDNGVHVAIGPQQDAAFLHQVVREHGPFDIIIDDGSHVVSHMIASFNALFDTGLKPDGIYLVEDAHSNYWTDFRDQRVSFVDVAKHLVDVMHVHYTQAEGEPSFRLDSPNRLASFAVPRITTMLDEIRFFDSVIVFCKIAARPLPLSERRPDA